MKGRSLIGKRCSCSARLQPQFVLDGRSAGAVLARIDQHVRSDLGKGRFEQDEVPIVRAPAGALAQQVHRVVKRVEAVFESGESGVELEGQGVRFDVAGWVRSQ